MSELQDVMPEDAVAIVGMACRFPGAPDVATFWRNLREGVESIARLSPSQLVAAGVPAEAVRDPHYVAAGGLLGDVRLFDAAFFGYTPRDAALIDPQQRLFLECAWEALEVAGCDSERFPGRISVFAGTGLSTYRLRNLAGDEDLLPPSARFQVELGTDKDYVAARTCYKLNLRGPSMAVQTACSTSLAALHVACQSLLVRQTDVALAGGSSIWVPQESGYWYEEGSILSPDGHCRAFDSAAQGTVPGCGVGVVVLKRLADAVADGDHVRAVIRGAAMNNDGALKAGFTAPSVQGQAEVIAEAHALAGVDPRSVTYVEAHGTGTPVGDPIEVRALTQAFRLRTKDRGFCALGSAKTNVGHLDTAAGVAGLVKAVLALEHGEIPATLHFHRPNPACELDESPFFVNAELLPWPRNGAPRRAGVSSFGMGGTNVHVVLEEAPARPPTTPARPSYLLLLSARSRAALELASADLASHLRADPDQDLADVAYTLQVGRRQFEHRRAIVCRDREQALAVLDGSDPSRRPIDGRATSSPGVVFMFPGQGSQHVQMGRDLYEHEPVFRREMDRCCDLLAEHLGLDLRSVLYPSAAEVAAAAADLEQTRLAQPAQFAVSYALARTWMEWGVRPTAVIGHSLGEYVAACLAGVITLEDALWLVAARGRLMQQTSGGAMLAVSCALDELQGRLPSGIDLAAVNGPRQCVVSGPAALAEAFQRELSEAFIPVRRLPASHPFHSAMLEPVVEPFVEEVRKVRLRPPELPFVSNVHGGWITAAEATDPTYWGDQLRRPVQFARGLQTLLADPGAVLVEVGPGATLSALARQQAGAGERNVISSMRRSEDSVPDRAVLLSALGRLWTLGVPIDWAAYASAERRRRVPLPTYPFERQRHWVEWRPSTREAPAADLTPLDPDPGQEDEADEVTEPYVAPRTELEAIVAEVWQEHFGLSRPIGVTENFFALGGQSLLGVELASVLRRRLDVSLSLATVFQNPTVEELAQAVADMRQEDPATEELLSQVENLSAEDVEAQLRMEAAGE